MFRFVKNKAGGYDAYKMTEQGEVSAGFFTAYIELPEELILFDDDNMNDEYDRGARDGYNERSGAPPVI